MRTTTAMLELPTRKKRDDILEDYFTFLERADLNQRKELHLNETSLELQCLKNSLTIFERNLDDLLNNEKLENLKRKSIYTLFIQSLKEWFEIFKELLSYDAFCFEFSYNLLGMSALLSQSISLELQDIEKDIIFFSPSRKDSQVYKNTIQAQTGGEEGIYKANIQIYLGHLKELQDVIYDDNNGSNRAKLEKLDSLITQNLSDIEAYGDRFKLKAHKANRSLLARQLHLNKLPSYMPILKHVFFFTSEEIESYRRNEINTTDIHTIIETIRNRDGLEFEWDVRIVVKGEIFNSAQIGYLMWVLSEAFESIDGVTVSLDNWGNGSRWMNIKLAIKNFFAKKEVKDLANKLVEAGEAKYLDQPIAEAAKTKAEEKKINKEADNLRDKEQSEELHRLEIIKLKTEIDGMQIDNQGKAKDNQLKELAIVEKKLELFERYSEVIKNAALHVDNDFEILINDMPFIKKEAGKLSIGKPIELIEAKEIQIENSDKK